MDKDKEKRDAEVERMARDMKLTLDKNAHKSGWDEMGILEDWEGLKREFEEAKTARNNEELDAELLDMANWIMFMRYEIKRMSESSPEK